MEIFSLIVLTGLVLLIPDWREVYFTSAKTFDHVKMQGRQLIFDWLKGIAIIAVIFIHSSYVFTTYKLVDFNVYFNNLSNNLTRFAIPVFFICSGILLTAPLTKQAYFEFYKRKLLRIFVPYLLVSFAVAIFWGDTVSQFIYYVITGKALVPFYFIAVLMQFYLLYPLLMKLKKSKLFLPVSFIISIIVTLIPALWNLAGIPLFFKFLFFFSYGLAMRDYFLDYKADKKVARTWLYIGLVYILIVLLSDQRFYNIRLFYGLAVFHLVFYYKDYILNKMKSSKVIINFGKNSLWIFLLHFPVCIGLYLFLIKFNLNYFITFGLIFVLTTIISYWLAKLADYLYKKFLKFINI